MFFYLANRMARQPPDIWHDPNAIALMSLGIAIAAIVVGAAVAIAIGVYQVRQGRTRRKLVYQVLSNAPLVSVNSAVADQEEIDIRVKGTPVWDAHLLVVNIKNVGNASIRKTDYIDPLTFEFLDTEVLDASVFETTPPDLIDSFKRDRLRLPTPQLLQFPLIHLNPGNTIRVRILFEGKGILEAKGTIDQGDIEKLEPGRAWSVGKFIMWTAVSMLLISALIFLLTKIVTFSSSSSCDGLFGISGFLC